MTVAIPETGSGMRRTRLLLVEDSETQALQIRRVLERDGFLVDRVDSGEAALESLNERLPDLVIADYHLPGMNGDELSRQIRLSARTRSIPVLMLTEARERGLERHGLESGADAYVPKSADHDVILLRLKALLRGRQSDNGGEGQSAVQAFRRASLLVVDDSTTFRTYLAGLLAREGYAVTSVANAEDALDAVRRPEAAFDCILVNMLGGFDGLGLCTTLNELRHPEEERGFQIVGIGSDSVAARPLLVRAFEVGMDDLIPATAAMDVVSARIRAVVRRKLLQDESRRAEVETRERQQAVERARAEAAAAEARAAMAEALARTNVELEDANRKLRDTQAKLVQAAKMASLGELVAGIAHEINNPLAFILGHQATIERQLGKAMSILPADSEAGRSIGKCRERNEAMSLGLRRIQDLVLNLRKFSRLDDGGFSLVNVQELTETVLALLAHKIGDRIEVLRRYEGDEELFCSPSLLNQVVMNIVGNAADAIAADLVDGQRGRIEIFTHNDAETYTIEIEDSGPGVPADLRERIFEPFFTTKPVGSGTGLGLAIAYNVVQAHKGAITVTDGRNGGARFVVAIPLKSQ